MATDECHVIMQKFVKMFGSNDVYMIERVGTK